MSESPSQSETTSSSGLLLTRDRPFALTFQSNVSFDATRLVMESAEELGVPAVVRRQLDLGQFRLGIIGLDDDTMGELVPAGSVVVIDKSQHRRDGWLEKHSRAADLFCLA